jgi:glyoxylase-like metal-dependent hydrolase (beta-lactamase superfamily II)
MTAHYEGDDLILHKVEVGTFENNTYVLVCPETKESLIVDGCFETHKILDAAEGTNVVGIVQTHGHEDHIQVLPELKEKLGVPVYAHPAEDYPVPIDVELSDGDSIPFGTRAAQVIHTPGHTQGSVCLLVGSHLISGDTLFPGGPGNTSGDKKLFQQIIDNVENKLFTLPDGVAVYPGHGRDTTIGAEKPQLAEWKQRGW